LQFSSPHRRRWYVVIYALLGILLTAAYRKIRRAKREAVAQVILQAMKRVGR
jgi:uncharacterized protein involved in exopolysaccharide biosynthesis